MIHAAVRFSRARSRSPSSRWRSPPRRRRRTFRNCRMTLEEAVRRAVDHNPDLAVIRLGVDSESARLAGTRGAFDPVFQALAARSGQAAAPLSAFQGTEAVTRASGSRRPDSRQRLRRGGGTWTVSWDAARITHQQPVQRFDPALQSGSATSRSHSRCSRTARSTWRDISTVIAGREQGTRRAAIPRIGRPDRRGRQAGVLDAQGRGRQCQRAAAVARAGRGSRPPEPRASQHRAGAAAGSRAGRGGGGAASREPDSRRDHREGRRGSPPPSHHGSRRRERSGRRASIRWMSRAAARRPTSSAPSHRRSTSGTISRARAETSRTRRPTSSFFTNQKLPDVRLEASYRGGGLGGTQLLRTGPFPGEVTGRLGTGFGNTLGQLFKHDLLGLERRGDGQLSDRRPLRQGEPRARRDRAAAGEPPHCESELQIVEAVRQAARQIQSTPNAWTRRAPARRSPSSASTSSGSASTPASRRRFW